MARPPTSKPATRKPAAGRSGTSRRKSPPAAAAPPEEAAKPASRALPPEPKPKRGAVSIPSIGEASTRLRTVTLNFAFVAAFLIIVPVIASQFWRSEVLIDPIAVPESLAGLGLGPDVAASRLWDGLNDARQRADTAKATLTAIPESQRVQFSLPETGFSVESLIRQTRRFFRAFETRIGGEFTCGTPDCRPEDMRLRIRVIRDRAETVDLPPVGTTPLREYFAEAGVRVLGILDPFVAIAATRRSNPTRATVLARNLIRQQHKDAPWAHNLIGTMLGETGDTAGAIAEFEAALALDPGFVLARANLASHLVAADRLDDAGAHYARLERVTDNPLILAGRAELLARRERPDEAKALLAAAIALDPRNPLFYFRLGEIAQSAGDEAEAEAQYGRALQLDPAFPPALSNLGQLYLGRADFPAAQRVFADYVELVPGSAEAHVLHGAVLRAQNDLEGALADFDRALSADAVYYPAVAQRAGTLMELGRTEEAEQMLDIALVIDPDAADVHGAKAEIALAAGRYDDALAAYDRAASLDAANDTYLFGASNALFALSRVPEAITRLEKALEVAPHRVDAWFAIGNYRKMLGEKDAAVAAYRRFLNLAPPVFADARQLAEAGIAELAPAEPAP